MGYDVQSQMWGQDSTNCTAKPNSPLHRVSSGIEQYLELGIDPKKIIFGVPWYGYVYPCESMEEGYQCKIKSVPFRGCPCSDAAGRQFTYGDIEKMLKKHRAKEQWDYKSQTPSFAFRDKDNWFQVRHDNVYSLAIKYNVAKYKYGLGGVGMWNANNLNYSNKREYRKMWRALPKGKEIVDIEDISLHVNIDVMA